MRRLVLLLCTGLAACFSEPGATADTDACAPGAVGCDCYANASCDPGFQCEESISTCIPENCAAGTVNCGCDAGACDDGLTCAPPGLCENASATSSTSADTAMTGTQTSDVTTSTDSSTSTAGASSTAIETTGMSTATGPVQERDVLIYLTRQDIADEGSGPLNLMPTSGLAAREFADDLCGQSADDFADLYPCDSWSAVLSIDVDDTILTLGIPPGEVFAATDPTVPFADSFSDFIATGPSNNRSLSTVGVRPSDAAGAGDPLPALFWTGSDPDGGLGETCSGWEDNDSDELGHTARVNTSGAGWISSGPDACNANFALLCACWSTQAR